MHKVPNGIFGFGILYVLKSSNALRIWNFQTRLFTFEEIGFELGFCFRIGPDLDNSSWEVVLCYGKGKVATTDRQTTKVAWQ